MSKTVSRFIDATRWLAALFVVLHHVHSMFINHADIMTAPHTAPVYAWWFLTAYSFGHGAVVVFFVLSGFLVGGALLERLRDGEPFLRDYFIDRTSRIYIVLLPALALAFILDTFGRYIFAGLNVYEHHFYDGLFDTWLILSSIFNLQGIWRPTYGTNMALWSLSMEYWYYIVFALMLLPLSRGYSLGARCFACVVGLALLVGLGSPPSYFLFGACLWALGALARIAPHPLMSSKWLALLLWVAVVVVLRLKTRGAILEDFPTKQLVDGANALLFANLLLTLRFDPGEGFSWCKAAFHRKLSAFSFTLYAVHMPILVWIWGLSAVLFGPQWRSALATPGHYAWAIGAVAVSLIASYGFSRLTEAYTDQARLWLRRTLPGGDAK